MVAVDQKKKQYVDSELSRSRVVSFLLEVVIGC